MASLSFQTSKPLFHQVSAIPICSTVSTSSIQRSYPLSGNTGCALLAHCSHAETTTHWDSEKRTRGRSAYGRGYLKESSCPGTWSLRPESTGDYSVSRIRDTAGASHRFLVSSRALHYTELRVCFRSYRAKETPRDYRRNSAKIPPPSASPKQEGRRKIYNGESNGQ